MSNEVKANPYTLALPPGVLLAERYRLVRQLGGSSAFAITYFAEDTATGGPAVVKEFFPRAFVGRGPDGSSVRPHSPEDERDFVRALRRFIHEGASLAEIAHPHLVRARRLLEANGTAYLMMDWQQATPLVDVVRGAGGHLAAADAGTMVQRLLSALEPLHADGIIHRDISPLSVHVLRDGHPVLLGFTARRHVTSQASDLAAGFAAFEQYGTREVGPWTDVYAMAAMLYFLMTGNAPPSALERATGDALASTVLPDVPPSVTLAVMRGLALLPQKRPHSASEFRRQLESAFAETTGLAAGRNANAKQPFDVASLVAEATAADAGARGSTLKLGAGGIVLPHEEGGAARLLRTLGDFTARFRRSTDRDDLAADVPSREVPAESTRRAAARARPVQQPAVFEAPMEPASVPPAAAARGHDTTIVPVEKPRVTPPATPVADAAPAPAVEVAATPVAEAADAPVERFEPEVERFEPEIERFEPEIERFEPEIERVKPEVAEQRTAPSPHEANAPISNVERTPAPTAPMAQEPSVAPRRERESPRKAPRTRFATESTRSAAPAPAREPLAETASGVAASVAGTLESDAPAPLAEGERQQGRRRIVMAAATILLIAGAGVTALVVRDGLRAQDVPASTTTGVAEQPATPTSPPAQHVGVAGGAVLQSVAAPDGSRLPATASDSSTTTASRTAPANRPASSPTPTEGTTQPARTSSKASTVPGIAALNVAIPTSTELKMVPPEMIVEAKGRLASGEEQAELGEYLAARRILRAVLQQIDSATSRYPSSQALRSLRREVEQADQNALRACIAENEMHRKRGEQPGSCQ